MECGKYGLGDSGGVSKWRHADLRLPGFNDASRAYRPSVISNISFYMSLFVLQDPIIKLSSSELDFRVPWSCEDAESCAPLAAV